MPNRNSNFPEIERHLTELSLKTTTLLYNQQHYDFEELMSWLSTKNIRTSVNKRERIKSNAAELLFVLQQIEDEALQDSCDILVNTSPQIPLTKVTDIVLNLQWLVKAASPEEKREIKRALKSEADLLAVSSRILALQKLERALVCYFFVTIASVCMEEYKAAPSLACELKIMRLSRAVDQIKTRNKNNQWKISQENIYGHAADTLNKTSVNLPNGFCLEEQSDNAEGKISLLSALQNMFPANPSPLSALKTIAVFIDKSMVSLLPVEYELKSKFGFQNMQLDPATVISFTNETNLKNLDQVLKLL